MEVNNFLPKIHLSSEQDVLADQGWDFPSDHLPVCGQIDNYQFGSFNLLNKLMCNFY